MRTVKVRFTSRRHSVRTLVADVPNYNLLHRVIVGFQIQSRDAVRLPKLAQLGTHPRFDDRYLPEDLAIRLEHFLIKHYVDGEQNFNCYSFMRYVTGLHPETRVSLTKIHYAASTVPHDVVRPNVPYLMRRNRELMHGAVGFTPTVCLSVLGDNQPLTWAPTSDLMRTYGADELMEVRSASHSPAY